MRNCGLFITLRGTGLFVEKKLASEERFFSME
jgi:hypothetical protein